MDQHIGIYQEFDDQSHQDQEKPLIQQEDSNSQTDYFKQQEQIFPQLQPNSSIQSGGSYQQPHVPQKSQAEKDQDSDTNQYEIHPCQHCSGKNKIPKGTERYICGICKNICDKNNPPQINQNEQNMPNLNRQLSDEQQQRLKKKNDPPELIIVMCQHCSTQLQLPKGTQEFLCGACNKVNNHKNPPQEIQQQQEPQIQQSIIEQPQEPPLQQQIHQESQPQQNNVSLKKPQLGYVHVNCQYCEVKLNIPEHAQKFTCGVCQKINFRQLNPQKEPQKQLQKQFMQFLCGSCKQLLKFEKGLSDFIQCTCGKVNFVANTGRYKTFQDYQRDLDQQNALKNSNKQPNAPASEQFVLKPKKKVEKLSFFDSIFNPDKYYKRKRRQLAIEQREKQRKDNLERMQNWLKSQQAQQGQAYQISQQEQQQQRQRAMSIYQPQIIPWQAQQSQIQVSQQQMNQQQLQPQLQQQSEQIYSAQEYKLEQAKSQQLQQPFQIPQQSQMSQQQVPQIPISIQAKQDVYQAQLYNLPQFQKQQPNQIQQQQQIISQQQYPQLQHLSPQQQQFLPQMNMQQQISQKHPIQLQIHQQPQQQQSVIFAGSQKVKPSQPYVSQFDQFSKSLQQQQLQIQQQQQQLSQLYQKNLVQQQELLSQSMIFSQNQQQQENTNILQLQNPQQNLQQPHHQNIISKPSTQIKAQQYQPQKKPKMQKKKKAMPFKQVQKSQQPQQQLQPQQPQQAQHPQQPQPQQAPSLKEDIQLLHEDNSLMRLMSEESSFYIPQQPGQPSDFEAQLSMFLPQLEKSMIQQKEEGNEEQANQSMFIMQSMQQMMSVIQEQQQLLQKQQKKLSVYELKGDGDKNVKNKKQKKQKKLKMKKKLAKISMIKPQSNNLPDNSDGIALLDENFALLSDHLNQNQLQEDQMMNDEQNDLLMEAPIINDEEEEIEVQQDMEQIQVELLGEEDAEESDEEEDEESEEDDDEEKEQMLLC